MCASILDSEKSYNISQNFFESRMPPLPIFLNVEWLLQSQGKNIL